MKYNNDQLPTDWITILPAPESIFKLLSCDFVTSCDNNQCACTANGITCTDMFKLKNCLNSLTIEENDDEDEQDNIEILDDSDKDEI